MSFFAYRPGDIFGIEINSVWLAYLHECWEKKSLLEFYVHFFSKRAAHSPWSVGGFFGDSQHRGPTTASWGGGWEWPEQPWLCMQSRYLWHNLEKHCYCSRLPIRDKVTPLWSQRLPEASFAFQQTARPCQANLIYVSMGSLHHILRLKQDPKKTLHFPCCFFSSWWSDKFPELSVKLLTSNLFNKLLIYFQVCLAIVLSPFSCFNILLLFKMSLLSCVDFQ